MSRKLANLAFGVATAAGLFSGLLVSDAHAWRAYYPHKMVVNDVMAALIIAKRIKGKSKKETAADALARAAAAAAAAAAAGAAREGTKAD